MKMLSVKKKTPETLMWISNTNTQTTLNMHIGVQVKDSFGGHCMA